MYEENKSLEERKEKDCSSDESELEWFKKKKGEHYLNKKPNKKEIDLHKRRLKAMRKDYRRCKLAPFEEEKAQPEELKEAKQD